jgi:hypothetical protein
MGTKHFCKVVDDDDDCDEDHCDLYEASEIGSPCQGLCHFDDAQPFPAICVRCGTHGNEGPCIKCVEELRVPGTPDKEGDRG